MDGQDYVLTIKGSPHAEKIRRSLTTLFDTRESSQPGDRDFGLSWQCLDEPPEEWNGTSQRQKLRTSPMNIQMEKWFLTY